MAFRVDETADTDAILATLKEAIPGDWQERMKGTEYVLRGTFWKVEVEEAVDHPLFWAIEVHTTGRDTIIRRDLQEPEGDPQDFLPRLIECVAPVVEALRAVDGAVDDARGR